MATAIHDHKSIAGNTTKPQALLLKAARLSMSLQINRS